MEYPNTGALFPNSYKKTEKDPNARGTVKVERALLKELMNETDNELIEIEISGWTKEFKDGKYLSLRVSKPYKKEGYKPKQDDDSEIPF